MLFVYVIRVVDSEFTVDIPTPDEHKRVTAALVKLGWFRFTLVGFKAGVVVQLARCRRQMTRAVSGIDRILAHRAGNFDEEARGEFVGLLKTERDLREHIHDLRGSIQRQGKLGLLDRITLRQLNDILFLVDDMIETLELGVDPEVREQLASELQRIAASDSPNAHVRTTTPGAHSQVPESE